MGLAWALAAAALLLAVAAGAIAWYYRRALATADEQLARERKKNAGLLKEFGGIAKWTPDGRLPENWVEIIREKLTPTASAAGAGVAQQSLVADSLLGAVRAMLAAVPPPVEAAGNQPEQATRVHSRAIELLGGLERQPKSLLSALANGDLDGIFGYWVRLDAYFPDADQTIPYLLTAAVLMAKLRSDGIRVHAPRPLSVVGREEADFTTEDLEGLRRNHVVRARAGAARFSPASGNERLVVDCISPGWSGPAGGRRPRLLVWDRSWQN